MRQHVSFSQGEVLELLVHFSEDFMATLHYTIENERGRMPMLSETQKQEYYQALVDRNPKYDGIFFAAIRTTGIFCHATCRAKKPKFANCEFYRTAEEALLAGYRPCKICQPLSYPQTIPREVEELVKQVEAKPEKRWREQDFSALGLTSVSARRKFREIYGMTFVQYARARRMGLAFKEINRGSKVIDQQLAMGYDSASGFHDAFTRIMGNPNNKEVVSVLYADFIQTPVGRMLAIFDEDFLYLLEFEDRRGLEQEILRLRQRHHYRIIYGQTQLYNRLREELEDYFKGDRKNFTIPLFYEGSPFQKEVWAYLETIPYGGTATYKEIACHLGDKNKVRAVGNANGANQIAILIPCHRVIASDGSLGGYGGGVRRKEYLLELEKDKHP